MKQNSNYSLKDAYEKLHSINQLHLLEYYPDVNEEEKNALLHDIERLDISFFQQAQKALVSSPVQQLVQPLKHFQKSGANNLYEKEGIQLLAQGKCALVVLAGGSGSRLRFKGPKGCFPISFIKKKSLFQLLCEKVKAASLQVNYPLEVAIMTSPLNHEETLQFFQKEHFFGLEEKQVQFFCQDLWPLLTLQGDLFLDKKMQIAYGPGGNGCAFRFLAKTPIFETWKRKGVEIVNVIPIDNPLADPFDAELFGFHISEQNELTIKATEKKYLKEKVGVIAEGPQIIEYSEICEENEQYLAYIGLFCVQLSFIEKVKDKLLPLHKAKKAVNKVEQGKIIFPEEPNCWKLEEFLFDSFPFSSKTGVFVYPRERCFAPLKNFEGEDSIQAVHEALMQADRKTFSQISGIKPSDEARFELSAQFYYPTNAFVKKWQGRSLPKESYID